MGGFEPHATLPREARREAWWIEGDACEEGEMRERNSRVRGRMESEKLSYDHGNGD
jgi:hypothetical protein